ncbi:MAG: SUMF1/EgtB/PvdO family nonheme iron enzyme [Anaerolineales bacterium]|nr:SUMF1/EgtB/PvdO family nonheme iron enzyme [Anaerolineales bacterium]
MFTIETWKETAGHKLQELGTWLQRRRQEDVPYLVYGTLVGLTLWPSVEAATQTGQFGAVMGAVYGVAAGVGANLLANQIEAWKNQAEPPTEDEVADWVAQQAAADNDLRQAVDAILEKLDAVDKARAGLTAEDRAWFAQTLATELAQLGNLERFTAVLKGSGAIAQGEGATAVGESGVYIDGNVEGNIITGDKNRIVETEHYYEHYHAADPSQAVDIPALRRQYLRRLLVDANTLSLTGIHPKAASDAPDARLNLGAVYTALLTTRMEGGDMMVGRVLPGHAAESSPVSALAQLNQEQHLALLGDPGSGKSTFVNFVAMCLAGECLGRDDMNLQMLTASLPDDKGKDQEERQSWNHRALLPLRVVLRDLAARGLPEPGKIVTADHLWRYLQKEIKTTAFIPYLRQELDKKGGLILLDGLDEVPEAQQRRAQIKQLVEDLVVTLPRVRILVTSRTYAYQKQDWRLAGFHEAVLAPFSAGQIRRFVDRWYGHIAAQRGLHETAAQGRTELLKRAIFGSSRLKGLAERPLLLTLMASLHAWRGGSFPEKREELYNDTVDLLLDWWESQRIVRDDAGQVMVIQPSLVEWLKIDRDSVRDLLHELAFKAHNGQPDTVGTADIPESDLVTGLLGLSDDPDLKPTRLIEFLSQRAGLIVPRGVKVYTFPHRTFQEYLAACYLTDHDYPDQIAGLVREDPNRWREVTLLAGAKAARGSASTIWSLVEALCYREPSDAGNSLADVWGAHLAGQALTEVANLQKVSPRNETKVARVKRWLLHIMGGSQLPATERAATGVNLAVLGDPRPEAMTVDGMQFCFVPKGEFWMGSDEDNPFDKDAERPLHKVEIPYDYWIGCYPVTNVQFQEFVISGGYKEARFWVEAEAHGYWKNGEVGGDPWIPEERKHMQRWRLCPYDYGNPFNLSNHPVVGINWYEALAFTRWLTQRWQAKDIISNKWSVQLPSELEWEKAAKGGVEIVEAPIISSLIACNVLPECVMVKNTGSQRRFPWGNAFDKNRVNGQGTGIRATNAVGAFTNGRSPYGVFGISGNVFDWTRSVWGKDTDKTLCRYPYCAGDGRENLELDDLRIVRGGSFGADEKWLRCAARGRRYPKEGGNIYGFRVVVSPVFTTG